MIWKDNRIQTNRVNLVIPGNKAADNRKNVKNRNVNANSANARDRVGAVKSAAAASRADDKPVYQKQRSGGR